MSKYILKTLIEKNKTTMTESASAAILAASSQAGISVTPSLSIMATGDVMGKIVSTFQIVLFGKRNKVDENHKGTNAKIV